MIIKCKLLCESKCYIEYHNNNTLTWLIGSFLRNFHNNCDSKIFTYLQPKSIELYVPMNCIK